ncbi:putative DNA replication regulator SLD2 [Rosellinia necatrix]|uniref:DNA replication regulator SLD2 n=1 Tax=Rosellinia necatrix TaxID=77044 RepID=A0A1S7UTT3_ROSNE|nr:putative DNA replication regulator SLD2 [Rosellinia necatrix]
MGPSIDEEARRRYEATSSQLRAELKQFEADWASRNGGKKPGRQDIKQNPSIASKYKQYNHVRDVLAGKQPATPPRPRKRTSENDASHTPSKRPKAAWTPSRPRTADVEDGILDTPSSRTLFSPAMPTSIGPTPQKNGRILGMFDLLDENTENEPPNSDAATHNRHIHATPSKRPTGEAEDFKLSRTPMSSSKRNMLNTFMTPSKRKEDNHFGANTPSSVSKLLLATPAFLRRAPMPTVNEDGEYLSPPKPLRLPRKPLGRSLSSVVAGLRKLEEEKLDDDLEALHEMENELNSDSVAKSSRVPLKALEPDSQAHQLLGGFDDEALYDSPTEEVKGRDGQPLRVYKKKGQKRTTRRVNMKPTRTKRPQAPTEDNAGSDIEEGNEDEGVVPETQFDQNKPIDNLPEIDSDSDFNASDAENKTPKNREPKKVASTKKKEGKVQKVARKVNELAHANFKRLKLRNTGSKGGPGFGSRFRRRR